MSFTKHPLLHYKSMNRIIPKMASSKRLINYQYTRGATAIDAIKLKVKSSRDHNNIYETYCMQIVGGLIGINRTQSITN